MQSLNDLYLSISDFICLLKSSGIGELAKLAEELDFLKNKVAWTTGSEFLEEIKARLQASESLFKTTDCANKCKAILEAIDHYIA